MKSINGVRVCVYTYTNMYTVSMVVTPTVIIVAAMAINLALQCSRIPMHNIRSHTYACNTQRMQHHM